MIVKLLKRSLAFVLAAMLVLAVLPAASATENDDIDASAFTDVNETVFASSAVNIRTGPSTDYQRIGTLPYGNAIRRTGIGSQGWSRVVYNGEVAYICSAYLTTVSPTGKDTSIDDSKLTRQIAIANGLNQGDYTRESWDGLASALDNANQALNSYNQSAVDLAGKTLEEAVGALVRIDYAALETSLSEASEFTNSGSSGSLWFELVSAVLQGESLLSSGDQAAVDDAAAQINEILAQIKADAAAQSAPEVVTQEVRVEVPPADDYCNISSHRVWPILFFASLAVNVALVALIVAYVSRRKKNQKDDTPLVDYDIFDDTL